MMMMGRVYQFCRGEKCNISVSQNSQKTSMCSVCRSMLINRCVDQSALLGPNPSSSPSRPTTWQVCVQETSPPTSRNPRDFFRTHIHIKSYPQTHNSLSLSLSLSLSTHTHKRAHTTATTTATQTTTSATGTRNVDRCLCGSLTLNTKP